MSTFSEVRNEIYKRYIGTYGSTPYALDNQPFDPPNPSTTVKWARVSVQFTDGIQDSFGKTGNRKFLKSGLLTVQVFTAIGAATDINDAFCQQVQDLFEGVRIDDIWFTNGGIRFSGVEDEWYQQNVVFDITFEDVK